MYMYTHSSPQDLADAQDLREYKRKLGIKDYNKDIFLFHQIDSLHPVSVIMPVNPRLVKPLMFTHERGTGNYLILSSD